MLHIADQYYTQYCMVTWALPEQCLETGINPSTTRCDPQTNKINNKNPEHWGFKAYMLTVLLTQWMFPSQLVMKFQAAPLEMNLSAASWSIPRNIS